MPSAKPTAKSSNADMAVEIGTSMRGKKTFATSAWLATSEGAARPNTLLKSVHPSMLMKENRKYGTPPVGRFATLPNTSEKMPAAASGWMSTHATPMAVCR
jgi:hypothetical protein